MTIVLGRVNVDPDRYRVLAGADAQVVDSAQAMHGFLDAHPDETLAVLTPEVTMALAISVAERYRLMRPALGIVLLRDRIDT